MQQTQHKKARAPQTAPGALQAAKMVKKRVDDRVKRFIEEGVKQEQRSLVVLVGDHGKDQVVNLHQMLARARVAARPSVLWCYKKELGFSTHRKKRMKQIKKQVARGLHDASTDEPFELFISQTRIRWCYYRDTQKILGSTYGCLVLQAFEALTPNLLARTIETVEGGGLVVLLLRTVNSLRQLYAQTMDVHSRFRGAGAHSNTDLVPRFNERFILSLADCARCLVLDDELNVRTSVFNVLTGPMTSLPLFVPPNSQYCDDRTKRHPFPEDPFFS